MNASPKTRTNGRSQESLSELLSVSRRLAESATAGEWKEVAVLELEQRRMLEGFFKGNNDAPMTAEMVTELAHVRVYTDRVLELAKKQRAVLAGAADTLKKGQHAVNAYADCP
ncbi:MAG: hypothetical protein HKN70_09625 [Gammaproteobacteria bacterium]|nr:hypothetical protein [Gammaproteobacteria bacterium]